MQRKTNRLPGVNQAGNPAKGDRLQAPYVRKRASELLSALAMMQYLTIGQATRMLYGKSESTTAEAFRQLHKQGLVKYIPMHRLAQQIGTPTKVYTLTRRGITFLAEHGELALENKIRNPWLLAHPLQISDFLISAYVLCRTDPRFRLVDIQHERILNERLRSDPNNQVRIRVKKIIQTSPGRHEVTEEEQLVSPILDAFFVMRYEGRDYPIGLEIDMGTESEEQWRNKIQALAQWIRGPYRLLMQRQSITIAVVTPSDSRRQQLRAWTRDELQKRNRTSQLPRYRFTAHAPASDPHTLFLAPVWQMPQHDEPVPLTDVVDQ